MTILTWWCVEGPPRRFRFAVEWVTAASAGAEKTHNPTAAPARALRRNNDIFLPFSKKTRTTSGGRGGSNGASTTAQISKGCSSTEPNAFARPGSAYSPLRSNRTSSRSRPLHSVAPPAACACGGRQRRLRAFRASQPPHAPCPETRTGSFPPTI